MATQLAFDTLAFVKRLTGAGMAPGQAEALAEALSANAFAEVATKTDLRDLQAATNADLKALGTDLRSEMKDMELRLTNTLTARFGAAMAASTALIVTILGALITIN